MQLLEVQLRTEEVLVGKQRLIFPLLAIFSLLKNTPAALSPVHRSFRIFGHPMQSTIPPSPRPQLSLTEQHVVIARYTLAF